MPPQQAGDLAWQANLIGHDAAGKATGWAAVDPFTFTAVADSRVFMVGDMIDRVSPLFGHYPKSGQMACRQGRIVARQITARTREQREQREQIAPLEFPDSVCHITTQFDPPEALRIETSYRLRGDNVIMQQAQTTPTLQPRGEDLAWAQKLFGEFLAPPGTGNTR
jgi:NADPH-dependent 2,4-dienoyl-CoA reductase/sulfur reductase-like enzyme